MPAQHLGHDQDQVRRRRAARQLAGQAHPDDVRHRLVQRLAQQHGLGLDAAHPVAQHAEAVDHRRVGVGPDQRVGEGHAVPVVHDGGQELEVDLVHDAGPGRDHAEVAERGLGPAQQLVALAVAFVLPLDVEGERRRRPEAVHLDAVVDDQIGRDERVDLGRVAAQLGHGVTHDREVDDGRDAREVLEDDPRRHERDLGIGRAARPPGCEGLDVTLGDDAAARVTQHVLEQDAHGDGQAGRPGPASQGIQSVQVRQARTQRRPGAERVSP
jgi:hypothetical protein